MLAGCNFGERERTPSGDETPSEQTTSKPSPEIVSDYSDLQEAVEVVSPGDTLLVDSVCRLTETVELKSDMTLIGAGGRIVAGKNMNSDLLRPKNVSDVVIQGVTFDGTRSENSGNRLLGGIDLGNVSNLVIRNCVFKNAANNAIELVDRNGGTIKNIYIANNVIQGSRFHGIIMGVKSSGGSIHDVIVENNTISDTIRHQDIGIFGQTSSAYNVAFIGNEVNASSNMQSGGTMIAFEEKVKDAVMYGNSISCYDQRTAGLGVSKDAENCIVANNYVENAGRSLLCAIWDYYDGRQDVCAYNLFTENHVDRGFRGFWYKNLDGAINVSGNRVTNTSPVISDGGGNTTDLGPYTFENNGSSISGGVPNSIGSSASWTDSNGNTLGSASWDRGAFDPGNSVSVSVQTYFDRDTV